MALALALSTLLVLAIIFTIAGVRKNDQIQELKTQAVPIDAKVTSCVGLLGGSGSNFVGYSCTGTYTLGGHRYSELLPGMEPHARGAIIHAVVVPSDPALISTPEVVASERATWQVFILPVVLFGIVLLTIATLGLVLRLRRRRA